jgi:hydrogenase nickel incorporation protein HypA/HybF
MHELAVAQSLVSMAEKIARENGANTISRITVKVGVMSGIHGDSLHFCFPMAAKGTLLAHAYLQIIEEPIEIHCGVCGCKSCPEMLVMLCEQCGSDEVRITKGKELTFQSMEVE